MLNHWFTDNPPAWASRTDNGDAMRNFSRSVYDRAIKAGWPRWAATVYAVVAWSHNDMLAVRS